MSTRSGLLLLAVLLLGLAGCGREEAEKAKKQLDEANANLAKLQDQVKSTQESFADLQKKHKDVTRQLQAAQKSTLDAKSKLNASDRRFEKIKEDMNDKLQGSEKKSKALQQQIEKMNHEFSIAETEQKSATALAARLRRENAQLKIDLQTLQEEVRQLRGINPSSKDKPGNAASENLPQMPTSAPMEKLPDPTNPKE